jgi:hypothetical protein
MKLVHEGSYLEYKIFKNNEPAPKWRMILLAIAWIATLAFTAFQIWRAL